MPAASPRADGDAPDLNPEQLDAVVHAQGPTLVVAGAGSGKTRVLTYRIAHLIALGTSPFRIIAITFTNKAAAEMRHRVGNSWARSPTRCGSPRSTPRASGSCVEKPTSSTCLSSLSTTPATRRGSLRYVLGPERRPEAGPGRAVHASISDAKNKLMGPGLYAERPRIPGSGASRRSTPNTNAASGPRGDGLRRSDHDG